MSKAVGAFFVGMGVAFLISFILVMEYPSASYISTKADSIYRDTGDARALEIRSRADAIFDYMDNFALFLFFATPISLAIGGILLWRSWKKKKEAVIEVEHMPKQEVLVKPRTDAPEGSIGEVKERLKELKKLYDEGLITEEEYKRKKEELLSRL